MSRVRIILGVLGVLSWPAGEALAQPARSRCADCHFAQASSIATSHITSWEASRHSRTNVGCDGCHGGNPTTFESFAAHKGMLPPQYPSSPVHRTQIVTTCGGCHAGPMEAFEKSRHFQLWKAGNTAVPTCTTCHSETGSRLLSPRAIEGQCNSCHAAGRPAARPEVAAMGRDSLQGIHDARELLKEGRRLTGRVRDLRRRAQLDALVRQAEAALVDATQADHALAFDALEGRLDVARRRIADLFDQLANPAR